MAEGARKRRPRQLSASETKDAAPAKTNGSSSAKSKTPAETSPLVALIVDDEPDMRETLRISLGLEGWTVEEADSGEAAVKEWHRISPSVVLLDQNLPGMSGLEAAAEIRAISKDARIILFSGYLDAEASKEARRLRLLPLDKTDRTRLFELLGVLAEQVRSAPARVS